MENLTFVSTLWRWESRDAWRFVTVPADLTDVIRLGAGPPRGFGSVRVEAAVGATTWRTSVFPDSHRGSFILAVKKAVREAEGIDDGDLVSVTLRLLDQWVQVTEAPAGEPPREPSAE